ncbi:MAG: hypothetical protein II453_13885 [Alphaproteobacteria bacterium]|nr:hypothetical protein [Alphaproteobacteria bacterium]
MEKIIVIVSNLVNSVQVIVDVLINLVFQPVFAVLTIIQSLIEIWSATDETEEDVEPQVTQYPSTNVGRFADEVEYPIGRNKIGFHINENEVDQINEIKRQLNK